MKRGFTLIELLVVISIIALLSSVVLVAVSGAKDKAEVAMVRQNMRTYLLALNAYAAENGTYPDPGGALTTFYCLGHGPCYQSSSKVSKAESQQFMDTLNPYLPGTPSINTNVHRGNIGTASSPFYVYYTGAYFQCTIAPCSRLIITWGVPSSSAGDCAPGTAFPQLDNFVQCSITLDAKK